MIIANILKYKPVSARAYTPEGKREKGMKVGNTLSKMLEGLKVIDITNNIAGPGAAAMLADHGAEVIHIEKPIWGDDSRNYVPRIDGVSSCFMFNNRGKKSVVMDLKDKKAVEAVKAMAADADVFLEANRPGVMERLGLSYEVIRQLNPRIIYCSISAFGQTGPKAQMPGYDIIAQAYSGMTYYTGEPGAGPVKNYFAVGDFVAGYNAFGSIMMALYHRERTGKGQYVDVSLARGLLTMNMCISDRASGVRREKTGNHDMHLCPYGIFKGPKGDTVIIGAINVNTWTNLCRAMKREELADDPRYITNDVRVYHKEEVIRIIEDWLQSFDTINEAIDLLNEYGVPNVKSYTVDDILEDDQALDQGWIRDFPTPASVRSADSVPGIFGYADFSEGDIELKAAPDLGEHNIEVLMACGMSAEEAEQATEKWLKG